MKITRFNSFFLFVLVTPLFLSSCSSAGKNDLAMLPLAQMPPEVKAAPITVQQAYQYAAANPDIMTHIPCYCGCGAMGHTSNYSCYVKSVDTKGSITFDNHALGCSICVDITQEVMRLQRQGKTLQEIRTFIDQTYSQYGPSNIP